MPRWPRYRDVLGGPVCGREGFGGVLRVEEEEEEL